MDLCKLSENLTMIPEIGKKLERYSLTCGPAVLARVKGISRLEAAILLAENKIPEGDWKYTNVLTLADLLGRKVNSASVSRKDEEKTDWKKGVLTKKETDRGLKINPYSQASVIAPTFSDRFPTLSSWIEKNRERIAILRIDHHFAYVGYTYVLESNGFDSMKGRVSHVIYLD